jgi:hypothetical protein
MPMSYCLIELWRRSEMLFRRLSVTISAREIRLLNGGMEGSSLFPRIKSRIELPLRGNLDTEHLADITVRNGLALGPAAGHFEVRRARDELGVLDFP